MDIYKTLFEKSREGILLTNHKGEIEMVNPMLLQMFGYDHEKEVIGKTIEIFVPDAYRSRHEAHRTQFEEKPSDRSMGAGMFLEGLRKNGTTFPVEISLSHFVNAEGKNQVAALVSDVTKKKEADEIIKRLNNELEEKVRQRTKELQISHGLYTQIARNFPKGTINVFDKNLNYIFVDGKELANLGIDSSLLKGSNYISRIPRDIAEMVREKLLMVFEGSIEIFELTVGSQIYELNVVPLPDSEGHISQILMVERNITEEKKAGDEIKKALEREKELNELKGRFVSMASHEFRTPLSSIFSSATLLEKYTLNDQQDKRDKHISRIKNSVINLIGILDDILMLSKVEEGKIELHYSPIELTSFAKSIIEDTEGILKKNQKIRMNEIAYKTFYSDAKLLRNIAINLVSNASKYSRDNGVIEIDIRMEQNWFSLVVKDNGIGIPEKDQKRLFERFFRADNVTNIEGTGLGLNIVKKYIELLDGNITFNSIPEVETCFMVKIPSAQQPKES